MTPGNDSPALAVLVPLRRDRCELLPRGSEEYLWRALRGGHPDAGPRLFDRYAPQVRRMLTRIIGPDPELLDLVQQVFADAIHAARRVEQRPSLQVWLTQCVVRVARRSIRRRQRMRWFARWSRSSLRARPNLPNSSDEEAGSAALSATYRILALLPTEQRILFALRFVAGMNAPDVAAALGMPVATVRKFEARAGLAFLARARFEPHLKYWVTREGAA